jgi:transcriptional regulator with XRE-family HTH domain
MGQRERPVQLGHVLPERLLEIRRERGLLQEDVASRMRDLGFDVWSRATVAGVETLRRGVPLGDVLGLAMALDVSVADLFGIGGNPDVQIGSGALLPLKHVLSLLSGELPTEGMRKAARDRAAWLQLAKEKAGRGTKPGRSRMTRTDSERAEQLLEANVQKLKQQRSRKGRTA